MSLFSLNNKVITISFRRLKVSRFKCSAFRPNSEASSKEQTRANAVNSDNGNLDNYLLEVKLQNFQDLTLDILEGLFYRLHVDLHSLLLLLAETNPV